MRRAPLLAILAACGGNHAQPSDASSDGKPIDGKSIDAMPDALIDAPATMAGAHRYVLDHEYVPTSNSQAQMYGLDLNSDGTVDNQLGLVLATLNTQGFVVQPLVDQAVDRGTTITLADLSATDLTTSASATFTLYDGANPMPTPCASVSDTVCRHHLAGTATFDVAATSAHDMPLAGAIASNVLTGGPGHLHLTIALYGVQTTVLLIGARVRMTGLTDPTITSGVIAGGLSQSEIDTKLLPAVQAAMTVQIAAGCSMLGNPPSCGCALGSTGATVIGLFDTNHDCAVSVAELMANALVQSLLAPDVTLEGQPALSFGIGVSAVHAAFTP